MKNCPKCSSAKTIKNGFKNNQQRFKCKSCSFQFTTLKYNVTSLEEKQKFILMYRLGKTMPQIAKIANVSVTSIFNWINNFRQQKLSKKDIIALQITKDIKSKKKSSNLLLEIRID